jgi:host factor-I protein
MVQNNIQDTLLNAVRKEKQEVALFLVNGFQIKGVITGFDNFVVIVSSSNKKQMVYKHAISTMLLSKPVTLAQQTSQG